MASIYNITGDILALYDMIDNEEMPDAEFEEVMLDTLESVIGEFEVKADGYGKLIRNLESDIEGIKKEKQRLEKKQKRAENIIKSLKDRILFCMDTAKLPEIKGDLFKWKAQNFGKQLPEDIESHRSEIPEKYFIPQDPKLDKKSLLADMKSGEFAIKGVELRTPRSAVLK